MKASVAVLDGSLHGDAFAGPRQLADGNAATGTSDIFADRRALQAAPSQLPAGGFLFIQGIGTDQTGNTTGGADIAIVAGADYQPLPADFAYGQSLSVDADGNLVVPVRDPASLLPAERRDTIALSSDALTDMGLSQLSLFTSGAISDAEGTETRLNPGGVFNALAGRAITIGGTITAPSGAIDLETANLVNGGSVVAPTDPQLGSFDITIDGTLSTRGRWANDFGALDGEFVGPSYLDGGEITIVAAPRVTLTAETATVAETRSGRAPKENVDISGSILINDGAHVDVSGGGYVAQDGTLDLSARGGNLSLYAETNYFQLVEDANKSPGGIEGFRVSTLIQLGTNSGVLPVNPSTINARVSIARDTVEAHGFAGGGTFTLATPEFSFGNAQAATGTALPLDFFSTSGFANDNIISYKTALIPNAFDNGFKGYNAVLATQTVTVGNGQTLNLSQSMFAPVPTLTETESLRALQTGGDLYSVLTPAIPTDAWDRRAVNLTLGGLLELHIASGGTIEGEAGARLTASKLFNEGTIRLPGGTVTQAEILPVIYEGLQALGVHDLSDAFHVEANGTIHENTPNERGISVGNHVLTNAQLADQYSIYLLGRLDADEGVRLAPGSVLDLSGTSILNPRAVANGLGAGMPIRDGRMVDAGILQSLPALVSNTPIFHGSSGISDFGSHNPSAARAAAQVNAEPGAVIDLSGAADSFQKLDADGHYTPTPQWSDAGTLMLGNGGTVTGADIDAHGGAADALGGTLIALDPVLYQDDPASPTLNAISAAAIAGSGFETMEALGSVSSVGDVTLNLGRAFFLSTRPFGNFPGQDLSTAALRDSLAPVVRSGGAMTIAAPYIRLESNFQTLSSPAYGTPGANSVTFDADTIDIAGAVLFDRSVADTTLNATHDVRLIGVQPYQRSYGDISADVPNTLAGMLAVNGNLSITAGQVYPTTGSTFLVTSTAADGTIAFARSGEVPQTPYSAGGNLTVQAASIVQGGVIRVPLGHLTLGGNAPLVVTTGFSSATFAPTTGSLHVLDGSVTSVSAGGLVIPYGTTTDQIEWFFEPTGADSLTAPPSGVLSFAGTDVALDAGASVDIRGGGDLYAYEFISGTGGSRDVLDRFNNDSFSSNDGFQYPDARQVFAIVPGLSDAEVAAFDPIYSADYADLTGTTGVGTRVYLSAAPGLAAGWYTLLPAKYALLPGGMRVVARTDTAGLRPDAHAVLKDGTLVVSGYFGTTGGDSRRSEVVAFDVQPQSVFRSYSNIAQTFANETFAARAARNGLVAPRLPIDAGRLVLNPAATLAVNTTIESAPGDGGRGAEADISGAAIAVVSDAGAAAAPGTIVLTADSLTNLNASSLLLGGVRTENDDGTTTLDVAAHSIEIANDAAHPLTAPEIILATDGTGASITVDDGAVVTADGSAVAGGDFIVDGSRGTMTGQGALLRVAAGPERLITRENQDAVTAGTLSIGNASIEGTSVLLDSSGDLTVNPAADITADSLALDAGKVTFTDDGAGLPGLVVSASLQTLFARADQLTIRTPETIDFSAGRYTFGNLRLDTPGLLLRDGNAVSITVGTLDLSNSADAGAACAPACGNGTLDIAASEIAFGSGTVRAYGFGQTISLSTTKGIFAEGRGGFDAGTAALTLDAPFIGDRAVGIDIGAIATIPALAFDTTGAVHVIDTSAAQVAAPDGTPGAQLSLNGKSITVTGTTMRATAGSLTLRAQNGVSLGGGAVLETPGYARRFGDDGDPVDVAAPGGRLALLAAHGNIAVDASATLSIGGGAGRAGTLVLSASEGNVSLGGTVEAAAPEGGGSFVLDSGSAFDLSAFAANAASDFDGTIDIRTRAGDLVLATGEALDAEAVRLTADAGAVDIAGSIDVSGANGGDVALFGADGVRLRSTASIDAHANGYGTDDTRSAKGGNVTLGTDGSGHIAVDSGATIDVSARHTAGRLVPQLRNGTLYYTYVAGDQGGTVTLRAPVVEQPGADTVNVAFAGHITGARAVVLEGFKHFDLADVAADPSFVGVTINGSGQAELDTAASAPGKRNFLADDGAGTLVSFVQDFEVSGAYGNLGGLAASPVFHARPGMELDYAGDIVLVSNWNLGAGSVDVSGAVSAGLMAADPAAPGKFYVIPGKEAAVLARFTSMVYRTDDDHDGSGDVTGEAGALTLRAGGTLDIQGSITDGFFQFRDQTDPDYLSGALSNSDDNPVPYSAAANTPAATGSLAGGTGDPIGSAEIFPLIGRAGHRHAVDSTSYRLVAGAASSSDPLRTDTSGNGDVVVEGERTYAVGSKTATTRTLVRTGTGNIDVAAASDIDLRNGATPTYWKPDGSVGNASTGLQVGGTSIYTAGHPVDLSPRTVRDPISGRLVTVDPGTFASTGNVFIDGPSQGYKYGAGGASQAGGGYLGVLLANPVYAEGGGDISLDAGGDVLGRREVWRQNQLDSANVFPATQQYTWVGTGDQAWRSGNVAGSPNIRVDPQLFEEGLGTLGGGNIRVSAGGDVSDLQVVATGSVSTASVDVPGATDALALANFGGGNVDVTASGDVLGGRLDMASGEARLAAGGSFASAGQITMADNVPAADNLLRLRLNDATIAIDAGGDVTLQGMMALGVRAPQITANVEANLDTYGFYSAGAGVSLLANGTVTVTNRTITDTNVNPDVLLPQGAAGPATEFNSSAVYPGSLEAASLTGTVALKTGGDFTANGILLYPSPTGSLRLFSAASIAPLTIAMDDSDPGILPGAFSIYRADASNGTLAGRTFIFPGVLPNTSDVKLAQLHNRNITHLGDAEPVRIYSGGDIEGMIVALPKQAHIGAARDIVNMMFFGQNIDANDITRITAGRDIIATATLVRPVISASRTLGSPRAALQGNTFIIGGPGAFFLEAGRDAGPFLNSAVVSGYRARAGFVTSTGTLSYGGGVLSIGDGWNRALTDTGADVYVLFGVGPGATYDAFRDYYVDPANNDALDGDLFEQVTNDAGVQTPDRTRPIYAPILIAWMKAHARDELEAAYGRTDVSYQEAYDVFKTLPELRQRVFLVSQVYFNELVQTSMPTSPSFHQYARGYRAVNTLFPADLGYTENDLTGGSNGANQTIETGNLDLRLRNHPDLARRRHLPPRPGRARAGGFDRAHVRAGGAAHL